MGCVFNHPTWQVTREEVHDALIASGASDEAAHDIINKIPFSRQGVVSTTILAEMFRAATHTDSETDSEEGSARLAFVHDSGARLVLAEQGGVHYRYAGTTHWERWFSDAGWQVRVTPCPSRQAVL